MRFLTLEYFHKTVAMRLEKREQRFFWVLASFSLSYRPLRACAFAQPRQTPKFLAAALATVFFKHSSFAWSLALASGGILADSR
jgi:hypothetical protein